MKIKSIHWEYEQEVRSFEFLDGLKNIVRKDPKGFDICLREFSPESVKEVIFGWQISSKHRKEITKIVAGKLPDAKLFKAKLSTTNFDLEIDPI